MFMSLAFQKTSVDGAEWGSVKQRCGTVWCPGRCNIRRIGMQQLVPCSCVKSKKAPWSIAKGEDGGKI